MYFLQSLSQRSLSLNALFYTSYIMKINTINTKITHLFSSIHVVKRNLYACIEVTLNRSHYPPLFTATSRSDICPRFQVLFGKQLTFANSIKKWGSNRDKSIGTGSVFTQDDDLWDHTTKKCHLTNCQMFAEFVTTLTLILHYYNLKPLITTISAVS